MSNLLAQTALVAEQLQLLQVVSDCGTSLLDLVNDVLELSKIESGAMELEKIPFHVYECVQSVLSIFRLRAREKRIDLTCAVDEFVPSISGDYAKLKRVLVNLVGNAIKVYKSFRGSHALSYFVLQFSEGGKVHVHVTAKPISCTNFTICFSVTDTGIGLSFEGQQRLFRPFSQVDASISRRFGGAGLGLVICKKIVSRMNGDISVESEEGKGSTFRFHIEASAGVSAPATPIEELANPWSLSTLPQMSMLNVLVVDDNK